MIRNIVFDMGNVVVRFDPEYFITREGITDPEDRALILRELFQSVEWAQMDLGVLTEETAEPLILSRIPERLHAPVRNMLFHWSLPEDENAGMEDLIRRLRQKGLKIWLLSNASVAHARYWPRYPASSLFDGVMVSAFLKLIKPMPEIYRAFTDRFRLKPEECLFIDDLPANAAGAVQCGWQALVYHGDLAELEKKLAEKHIL